MQCSSNNSSNNAEIGLVNKLAVTSLLQRFNDVVKKYVEDENLSGKCPLPRHRMAEISFVLKALATLVCSLKKAPKETGNLICLVILIIKKNLKLFTFLNL